MPEPRRHHYVPQFYLRRFADSRGRVWVWDKATDRIFASSPVSIAVETDFYKIHDFVEQGYDPYLMEKQLAGIDGQMSLITGQWIDWLREIKPTEKIEIPAINRQIVSRFMSLQFLRTADTKDILWAMYEEQNPTKSVDKDEKSRLRTEMLWNLSTVDMFAEHIEKAVWIFARNPTQTPLVTSDNPVAFRTKDNRMWLRLGFLGHTYTVYPLSPDIVMFCHDRANRLERYDQCLSPVVLDEEMVESENSGQVFMANRFLISPANDFRNARDFTATIGTDKYTQANVEEN